MKKIYKKIILLFSFCCCLKNGHAIAAVINPSDQEPPVAQNLIFQNRSVLKCGAFQEETIFTLLDVETLLAISNFLSKYPIPLTTDWNNFSTPKINLYRLSYETPQDVLRILFLCLNWQDTKLANLFSISDTELKNDLERIKKRQPWDIYSDETQQKINSLSDASLKQLVEIVLRANLAEPVRGNLKTNQSLKSVKFTWLVQ